MKKNGPMSKFVVRASMIEAWISAIVCIIFCWFDKDISSLVTFMTVSWGGYELVKGAYIWMAKNEHVEAIRKRVNPEVDLDAELKEFFSSRNNDAKTDI